MGKLRFLFALWMAKLSVPALKITRHEGTDFPGSLACKLCPDFLGRIGKPASIVAVTGTNGKTTVSNTIADILEANGRKVLSNRAGSNMWSGIATTLLAGCTAPHLSEQFAVADGSIPMPEITPVPTVEPVQQTDALLRYSGGDARKLLNILELVISASTDDEVTITDEMVEERLQQNPLAYDKDGEMHYDIISAFIKSIRGSDPDAALYWMARMIEGGEDPKFIARRVVISAAEDVGLANPNALLMANTAFDVVNKIGWPEGRIALAEAVVYLATSPKSNSAYLAIDEALAAVRATGNLPVPLPIRNAPTALMKELGYHDGYLYPHDYPGNFVAQSYLPSELGSRRFWHAQHSPSEEKLYQRMLQYWGDRYKDDK